MCRVFTTPSGRSSPPSAPTPTSTPTDFVPSSRRWKRGWRRCRPCNFPSVSDIDVGGTLRWRVPVLWRLALRLSPVVLVPICRLRVSGDVPDGSRDGPLILAANHIGAFDPFVLAAACARRGLAPRILATGGLFRAPVLGAVMRAAGHLRVDRRRPTVADALPAARRAVDGGAVVLAYPEGRITLEIGRASCRGRVYSWSGDLPTANNDRRPGGA